MAEQRQFGRVFVIELGDLKLEMRPPAPALRVKFLVERDKTEIPNNVELAIWNLSPAVRAKLEQERELSCRVQAGYGDEPSQIFTGIVGRIDVVQDRRNGENVTRVSAGDGLDKYQNSKVSETFAKGTSVHKVLEKLIAATGLKKGNVSELANVVAMPSGATELELFYVAHGSAMFELQVFADSLGIDWSFQDGQFVGARRGQPYNSEGPLLSPATGLLDVRLDERGNVEGSALLLADLLPGVAFRVESDEVNGDFICVATEHSGDNYNESDWTVSFHGIPFGATSDGLLPEKTKEEDKAPTAASTVL